MATILLQAAGAFLSGMLGPIGTAIGTAAGALAGYVIDSALINGTRRIEGPRLTGARPFTAEEGASLPRIYGTARVGGTLIWATRFKETRSTRRQGKMGPKVTEYAYYGNAAFALCEGEIAGIRRVWADGREIDRETIELRVHRGTENQAVDPLIAAKQGSGNAPAYRGVAYAVVENLDLGPYGHRMPQMQFEVIRSIGDLRKRIRAVSLIPGATEYGLSTSLISRQKKPGETEAINRHVLFAGTDFAASLDELQMICPSIENVALVVAWFGNDLRAGQCLVKPGVTSASTAGLSKAWQVSGLTRSSAGVVSTYDNGPAYGGTPSDRSVREAIAEIKARGLKVTLYPFIMMDIPAANSLPDPYGAARQPSYPWRGRITCIPAPQMPGTTDRTAAARSQVDAFCGSALRTQFAAAGDTVNFGGSSSDWGYRRFILHYAHLAAAAGGVDAFLIGTELCGLTTLRDGANAFPFVEKLCALAADVRVVLGPACRITYGADWSEYFGHQPSDGSGDVYFHLDALWAHPAINAIGIDNYMPLSDWRDADYAGGNPDGFDTPYDLMGLRASITAGEGFDWYYPGFTARLSRSRTPITDTTHGKPWVFRYKDLVGWWSNPHYDRPGGVEAASPTAWVPSSKPIWFTELGCPAVDKGPNQPNMFPDTKSVEDAAPYFSNGGRSDIAPRRLLEAHALHWDPVVAGFHETSNPVSPAYGRRMVDVARSYVWAWDARPYPAFPLQSKVWSDSAGWHRGHWLNGRLNAPSVADLINEILQDHGLPVADVAGVEGTVSGYVVGDPSSARAALEPLIDLFGLSARQEPDRLVFRQAVASQGAAVELTELAFDGESAVVETVRTPDHDLPVEALVSFGDPANDYQSASARSKRFAANNSRQHTISFPGMLEAGQASALAEDWMRRTWQEREQLSFALAEPRADIVPGCLIKVPASGSDAEFLVTGIEQGLVRKVAAKQIARAAPAPWRSSNPGVEPATSIVVGQPHAVFLDLPMMGAGSPQDQFRVAVRQVPWRSQALFASPEDTGFVLRGAVGRRADMGRLRAALLPSVEGRLDRATALNIELYEGDLASVSRLQLLNGANLVAVQSAAGTWEILQFEAAEETAPGIWRLSNLLRGQFGTGDATAAGATVDADVVVLDTAVVAAGLSAGEAGLLLNWRVGPLGGDFSSASFSAHQETGGKRALMALSPVHLRGKHTAGGDLLLSWIRRGRLEADSWQSSDIPLGEEREEYRIDVAAVGGAVVRSTTVSMLTWTYAAADIAADFGTPPAEVEVTVRQLSVASGWGVPTIRRVALA
ncbi:glycoside hydrolase/phage tail family protein [Aminobacter aminovorans]|uniref:baseplate multidomain protein megatron n=1 Tax=Aminobacter aminovorans TaxID=83263 RepID=UPI00286B288C|nr:glycoside hydrolase/phage tail family protein [Aminobacter aminovorans]